MTEHPLCPTDEQLAKWESDWFSERENADVLLIQAFQAGADAELEACVEWISKQDWTWTSAQLRAARRPNPPSLKQQACDALDAYVYGNPDHGDKQNTYNAIRRALEQLPDD